eukprot:667753-Amphidinium_carterae.2
MGVRPQLSRASTPSAGITVAYSLGQHPERRHKTREMCCAVFCWTPSLEQYARLTRQRPRRGQMCMKPKERVIG